MFRFCVIRLTAGTATPDPGPGPARITDPVAPRAGIEAGQAQPGVFHCQQIVAGCHTGAAVVDDLRGGPLSEQRVEALGKFFPAAKTAIGQILAVEVVRSRQGCDPHRVEGLVLAPEAVGGPGRRSANARAAGCISQCAVPFTTSAGRGCGINWAVSVRVRRSPRTGSLPARAPSPRPAQPPLRGPASAPSTKSGTASAPGRRHRPQFASGCRYPRPKG